jgi:hypothetical protein
VWAAGLLIVKRYGDDAILEAATPSVRGFSFDRGTLANTRRWLSAACWRLERSTGTEPLPYFFSDGTPRI